MVFSYSEPNSTNERRKKKDSIWERKRLISTHLQQFIDAISACWNILFCYFIMHLTFGVQLLCSRLGGYLSKSNGLYFPNQNSSQACNQITCIWSSPRALCTLLLQEVGKTGGSPSVAASWDVSWYQHLQETSESDTCSLLSQQLT